MFPHYLNSPLWIPFCLFCGERKSWQRRSDKCTASASTASAVVTLCWHSFPFSAEIYSSVPHYGDGRHANSITEDLEGRPYAHAHTHTRAQYSWARTHIFDKVTGNLILCDVTLLIYGAKANKHCHHRAHFSSIMAVMYTVCFKAELRLQTLQM